MLRHDVKRYLPHHYVNSVQNSLLHTMKRFIQRRDFVIVMRSLSGYRFLKTFPLPARACGFLDLEIIKYGEKIICYPVAGFCKLPQLVSVP